MIEECDDWYIECDVGTVTVNGWAVTFWYRKQVPSQSHLHCSEVILTLISSSVICLGKILYIPSKISTCLHDDKLYDKLQF